MAGKTILIVDDEPSIREMLRLSLEMEGAGNRILTAENGRAALDLLVERDGAADIVITDYHMPEMNGLRLLQEVARRWPRMARILLTGDGVTEEILRQCPRGTACFPKPIVGIHRFLITVTALLAGGSPPADVRVSS